MPLHSEIAQVESALAQGDWRRALAEAEELLRIADGLEERLQFRLLVAAGRAAFQAGDMSVAVERLTAALPLAGDRRPWVAHNLGMAIYHREGNGGRHAALPLWDEVAGCEYEDLRVSAAFAAAWLRLELSELPSAPVLPGTWGTLLAAYAALLEGKDPLAKTLGALVFAEPDLPAWHGARAAWILGEVELASGDPAMARGLAWTALRVATAENDTWTFRRAGELLRRLREVS